MRRHGVALQAWAALHVEFELASVQVTCLPRQGSPADYVSRSAGYDWPNFDPANPGQPLNLDPDAEREFGDFLAQIFPVPEERDLLLRYLGYAMLGSHQEKYLAIFTDKRGGRLLLTLLCIARQLRLFLPCSPVSAFMMLLCCCRVQWQVDFTEIAVHGHGGQAVCSRCQLASCLHRACKPKLFYQAKFDRDINEVSTYSGVIAPFAHASAIGIEQGFALLQHSEGWLPFDRILLVLVEKPSHDKPSDIPLLLDICGGGFKLT